MSTKPSRPNIILVNCDDLGYGDLGCYGSQVNDTPHLDRLAQDGMRFTDFYMASPVCSASRAAMLTGCYSQRIGFADDQVLFPGSPIGLNPSETTLGGLLQQAGYATKIIGKWHCGDQPEFLPTRHGFDSYFGLPYSNDMGRQADGKMANPPLPLMRDEVPVQQQPDQRGLTERYVDESIQFIRAHQTEPFFLYLAHMYVHVPLFVPQQFLAASRNGAYGGAVAAIDWAMASIDAELDRLGIRDDTLVIFTSDNGSRVKDEGGSNGVLRGSKSFTWEGGQRVPCIMRWPGRIRAGSTCHDIVTSMDFFATFAELTGVRADDDLKRDSLSLLPVLLTVSQPRDTFAYYSGDRLEAIRVGDWKLHFCKKSWRARQFRDPEELQGIALQALFNLREDPGETHNCYDTHPDIVTQLTAVADTYRQQLGDVFTGTIGQEIRPAGRVAQPQTLTHYDESHPYMVAYYDLADMPTMSG